MFSGSIPALVTPFRDGALDMQAFARLVDWQIKEGTSALVPCPYYNRPTQEGMLAHFRALADASDLPIVVYNVPGRTVADISAETMCKLAEIPTVVATKDASGDLARVTMHRAGAGADFCQLSGNDDLWLPHAVLGGAGCISVTANVAPRLCADFAAACAAGDWARALVLHDRLFPLHKAMFTDASPAPVKYALSRVHDWFSPDVRLPIIPASAASRAAVDAALVSAGVL